MDNVIALVEILAGNNFGCTPIGTYVLAIMAELIEFDLPIEPWLHNKVARILKVCACTEFPPPSSMCYHPNYFAACNTFVVLSSRSQIQLYSYQSLMAP